MHKGICNSPKLQYDLLKLINFKTTYAEHQLDTQICEKKMILRYFWDITKILVISYQARDTRTVCLHFYTLHLALSC